MEANYVHKDSTTLVQDKFIKNGVFSLEYDKETLRDMVLELQEENARLKENQELKNQQKEFIEYMTKTIEELECEDVDDEEMKGYLIQRIDTFKEILQKYRSIIGVSDEKEN